MSNKPPESLRQNQKNQGAGRKWHVTINEANQDGRIRNATNQKVGEDSQGCRQKVTTLANESKDIVLKEILERASLGEDTSLPGGSIGDRTKQRGSVWGSVQVRFNRVKK